MPTERKGAVAAERERILELAYRAIDEEEELEGDLLPWIRRALEEDLVETLRTTVRATKRSIRARLVALIEEIEAADAD